MDRTTTLFSRGLTPYVTRLDLIKSCALVIMVIDHLGAFFFPDIPLLRAIGRACVPIWFFLAGYNRPKNLFDPHLLIGGSILACGYVTMLYTLYPLNSLFSIFLIHAQTLGFYALQRYWKPLPGSVKLLLLIIYSLVLALYTPLTSRYWEYGSIALLLGLCGMFKRDASGLKKHHIQIYQIAIVLFVAWEQTQRHAIADNLSVIVCATGLCASMVILSRYTPHSYNGWTSVLLRLGGRYTMEFYVIHLLLFTALFRLIHL